MNSRNLILSLIGLTEIFLVVKPAIAAVRTVTNLDDSGPGSLRNTIAVAGSGDTINFALTGTILLTSGEIQSLGKNLNIIGPGSPSLIHIQRNPSAASFRIFSLGGTVSMSGLTISRGYATSQTSCASNICVGGAILNTGNLTLNNCLIDNNQAIVGGGGIYNSGTLSLINSTISSNTVLAGSGGGVENRGTLIANSCTFDGNEVDIGLGNRTGGGVYSHFGALTLNNCTFYRNVAESGGAIYNQAGSSATITSCTLSDNRGLNSFSTGGLGNNGNLTLRNTILARATVSAGQNLSSGAQGTFTSQGYNLSSDDGNGLLTGTGDQINTDPKLDPYGLLYSAGFTKTIALRPGSPAIDKGKSFGLTSDQRGQPRPVDNPFVASAAGGDGSDIGAYEAPSDPIQSDASLIVTTRDDHDDGICGGLDCTLREAILRANLLPGLNTIILDGSLQPAIALQTRTLGQLIVNDSTTILGPGARVLALKSDGYNRVFSFLSGASTVSGLTIRDGITAAGLSTGGTALGGGIYNQATLTINDCNISENRVLGGSGGSPGSNGGSGLGGGIYNVGTLTLNRCSFIHNGAFGGAGSANLNPNFLAVGGSGGHGQGSAVCNASVGTVEINNSTFFNNVANGGSGANGSAFGGNGGNGDGTVFNQGNTTVTGCTLNGNFGFGGTRGLGNNQFNHGFAGAGRGGLSADTGTYTVRNTISAGNTGVSSADVGKTFNSAGFISGGYNLIGKDNNNTGFTDPTDLVGSNTTPINPILSPMQNNGGPTDTMALLYGSPAIDQGKSIGLSTDQRGTSRPIDTIFANATGGDGTDIGAVEMNLHGGPDSDGDGMSDDFEKFYGVNDPNTDPDHDGQTSIDEYHTGTDPTDPSSSFRILSIFVQGDDVWIRWISIGGKTNTVETATIADDGSYTNNFTHLATLIIGGSGPVTNTYVDVGGALSFTNRYYRVRLVR